MTKKYKVEVRPNIAVSLEGLTYDQYLEVCDRFEEAGFEFYIGRRGSNNIPNFLRIDQDGDIMNDSKVGYCGSVYTYKETMETVEEEVLTSLPPTKPLTVASVILSQTNLYNGHGQLEVSSMKLSDALQLIQDIRDYVGEDVDRFFDLRINAVS